MYVSLKPGYEDSEKIINDVKQAITTNIGPIARPSHVWVTSDLPKTGSGKIMRRVIAAISNFVDVGDTTTLANPEVVEDIQNFVQNEKKKLGEIPQDISKEVEEEIKRFGSQDN